MSVLEDLLHLFIDENVPWDAFTDELGVQWQQQRKTKCKVDTFQTIESEQQYYRRGYFVLSGFMASSVLPNRLRRTKPDPNIDNEGYARLQLIGDSKCVHAIEVMKFYVTRDTRKFIKQQFSGPVRVTSTMARGINAPRYLKPEQTYFVKFPEKPTLLAEVFHDEHGSRRGPGSTTLFFTKLNVRRIVR